MFFFFKMIVDDLRRLPNRWSNETI